MASKRPSSPKAVPSTKQALRPSRPKGLGRGLDTLLGADIAVIDSLGKAAERDSAPATLAIAQLQTGRYQPRTRMDEGALAELAESIRTQGIMQPVLVRPLMGNKPGGKSSAKTGAKTGTNAQAVQYEIIAGERRVRAAQLAGLKEVPVLVREVADENAAIMALIENIQREDLNPLEEAQGVKRLLDEFGLTHEQAAQAIGRSRSATSNLLRLLNLCPPVQTMLLAGDIDMGHARALLVLESARQVMVANEIIARRWSVRDTEKQVQRVMREQETLFAEKTDTRPESTKTARSAASGDTLRLERALADELGTQVRLKTQAGRKAGKGGQLIMDFHDWAHLDALLERLGLACVLE